LFIELIYQLKKPLESIKNSVRLSREYLDSEGSRESYCRTITEDIEKIDLVVDHLLNFIKISTPVARTNTIHVLIEEGLKKFQNRLEEKKMKVLKRFAEELPETTLPDAHVSYILSSILQYAVNLTPPHGSIGFLTRSLVGQREAGEDGSLLKGWDYVEILVGITGYRRPAEEFVKRLGIPVPSDEEILDLELRLAKEVVRKNEGMMKFEGDEKRGRTILSLRLPVERRKMISHPLAPSEDESQHQRC
jgi:nitrogen-specific signal transduction histidine kinase